MYMPSSSPILDENRNVQEFMFRARDRGVILILDMVREAFGSAMRCQL